jgi:protein ImuB
MFGALHSPAPLPSNDALVSLAREFTPRVESIAPSPVLMDLRGLGRVWSAPEALGRALVAKAQQRRVAVHVALAFSRIAALLLAKGRPGLTIVDAGDEAAALAPLPLTALGVEPERAELFRRWGLQTLGDLAALPPLGLSERLGPEGPQLVRLARGEDLSPLVATPPSESFECSLELDWPVDGLEPLSFLLARVLEPLCARLSARHRRAAALALELRLADGDVDRRRLKPAAPSAEPRTWRTLLLLDLEARPISDAVLGILVRAEPTPSRSVQFSLLDPAQPSPEALAETLARLDEWTKAGRGGTPTLLDSHRPGAFVMTSFQPGPLREAAKPIRPRLVLRAFRPPLPAHVTLRDAAPVFVAAGAIRGTVVDRAGPWRASGDWWDVAWSRTEWDVALAGRGLFRVFHDMLRQEWFVEGELD